MPAWAGACRLRLAALGCLVGLGLGLVFGASRLGLTSKGRLLEAGRAVDWAWQCNAGSLGANGLLGSAGGLFCYVTNIFFLCCRSGRDKNKTQERFGLIPGSKICYLGLVFGGLGAASKGRILEAASRAVDWFGNAMQGHCKVNRIFCLLGDFVLLLISSFYVAGVGETRTRHKKGLVLSQVVRFAIWDWSLVDWVLLARGGFWRQQAGQLIGLAMQCRVIARSIEFSAF